MLRFDAHIGWLFTELPFEERFSAAAKVGFEAIENPNLFGYPVEQLQNWLGENELMFVQTATPTGNPENGDRGLACRPERVTEFREGVERAIELAQALNIKILHAMAGLTAENADPGQYYETYIENLRYTGRACAKHGIKVIIEPISHYSVPGFYLNSPNMAVQAIRDSGDDNVYLLFDYYHAQCAQGNLVEFVKNHIDLIGHIQLADAPNRNEPGTGEINYRYVLSELDKLSYNGWVGCEYKPSQDTISSLKWLDPAMGQLNL
ncbi:MAG: TIM barrel protein [Rhodospirillaceae bacterium]|jgi:hydroxypyruvate isomerase